MEGRPRRAKKSLGQNFLRARWVARLFAEWACRFQRLAEIGAGEGAVTREVITRCPLSQIYLLELDERLIPSLLALRLLSPLGEVLLSDALSPPIRLDALEAVYGSIPYNITGPLLSLLALSSPLLPAMLLVQREVAARLAARPGTRSYGRISVLVQLAYRVRTGPVVPPTAFRPRPRVYSRVVYLEPRNPAPPPELLKRVEAITRCMFSQRNRLAAKVAQRCIGRGAGDKLEVLEGRRVYQLEPEVFLALAKDIEGTLGNARRLHV